MKDILADNSFWAVPEDERNRRWKGCGPGTLGDKLVPDSMWGLSVRIA